MALVRTTWRRLEPALRDELRALLRAPTAAYHSQYGDAAGWWLLLSLACVGGAGAAVTTVATDALSLSEWAELFAAAPLQVFFGMLRTPHWLGLFAAVGVGAWTAVTWARNHRRRGLALLTTAVVVVRGAKLTVLRYADVVGAERSQHGGRGKRFTALTLKTKDGAALSMTTTDSWADAALDRMPRS